MRMLLHPSRDETIELGHFFFFFKQKTAYEIRPCDWSSDVCSSDLIRWERPTVQNVRQLIKHPAFAGAYVYGRRHWRRVQGGGEPAPANRVIGQFVEMWDHHEGYISKE